MTQSDIDRAIEYIESERFEEFEADKDTCARLNKILETIISALRQAKQDGCEWCNRNGFLGKSDVLGVIRRDDGGYEKMLYGYQFSFCPNCGKQLKGSE